MWLALHLVYLTGFKNRVTALGHWAVSFLGTGRQERVATEQQIFGRRAMNKIEGGAAGLASSPGEWNEIRDRLEAQARLEAELTDSGKRGVHAEA